MFPFGETKQFIYLGVELATLVHVHVLALA
jgi:hypothetical protein